jgi:hypothetical protein
MSTQLRAATIVLWLAVGSAIAGGLNYDARRPLGLALYALAILLAATVGLGLLVATVRDARQHRSARRPDDVSPIRRLEYLPPVTTRAPRVHWQGSRYAAPGPRGNGVAADRELVGSAHPTTRPARDLLRVETPAAGPADAGAQRGALSGGHRGPEILQLPDAVAKRRLPRAVRSWLKR